jgi:5-methylcytosine-specific restriction endonuclease McrA
MIEAILNITIIISITALVGVWLWRHHLSIIGYIGYKKVVVPMSKNPTYYWHKTGETVSATLRYKVYVRDNWRCGYCGVRVIDGNAISRRESLLLLTGAKPGNIDHLYVPEKFGGLALYDYDVKSDKNNLIASCQQCNVRKKAKVNKKTFRWLVRRGETICLEKN